jgi:hypothetical protein
MSRIKNHYKERANWHKKYIEEMAVLNNNTCQICSSTADKDSGAIHHKKYTGHDYKKDLQHLISLDAVVWICKLCHKKEHIAICRTEVNYKFKNSGFCILCEKFAWKAWFNINLSKKIHVGYRNFPLCLKCQKRLVKMNILKQEKFRGQLWTFFSDGNEFDKIQNSIYKIILERMENDCFGDKNSISPKEDNQIEMF